MAKIKATRNGEKREFEADFWAKLPDDKYGWVPTAETPEEVKKLQATPPPPPPVEEGNREEGIVNPPPPVAEGEKSAETPEEVKKEKPAKNADSKK